MQNEHSFSRRPLIVVIPTGVEESAVFAATTTLRMPRQRVPQVSRFSRPGRPSQRPLQEPTANRAGRSLIFTSPHIVVTPIGVEGLLFPSRSHTKIYAVILRKRRSFAKRTTCRRRISALARSGCPRSRAFRDLGEPSQRSLQAATAPVLCSSGLPHRSAAA